MSALLPILTSTALFFIACAGIFLFGFIVDGLVYARRESLNFRAGAFKATMSAATIAASDGVCLEAAPVCEG